MPAASKNKDIVDGLRVVLANTFVLYFKTHSFHWNVEGPHFKTLHELFEEQYRELWAATDQIAERIRMLGEFGPNNWQEMTKSATLQETGQTPDAAAMLEILANDNDAITEDMSTLIDTAQDNGDEVTADLMIQRMSAHEKAAWMLRSHARHS